MDHDYAQRRRLAVAIAITVIAVPAAFLLNRGDGTSPDLTSAAEAAAAGASPTTPEPAATSPLGTAPVGYLAGSTVPRVDEPARIAIPQLAPSIKGPATYSSRIPSTTRCQVPGVPFNATVLITNLDNSRRVRCIASVAGLTPDVAVVLATDTFAEIADLTDAPVPVEITWTAPATIAPPVTQPTGSAPATAAP